MDITIEIKRAQQGDKEAFIHVIQEIQSSLYKVAYIMLQKEEDCGDAIQEAILSAYKNLGSLKKPEYFKTWITKILINQCKNIARSRSKLIFMNELIKEKSYKENFEDIEMYQLLAHLREEHRTVLLLYYVNDVSVKESAAILDIPLGTVKSRLSRGRDELKKLYYNHERGQVCHEI